MMKIGIDIDGVITDIPELFKSITNFGNHEIHIITYRDPKNRQDIIDLLKSSYIRYDHLHIAPDDASMIEWKKAKIIELGIDVMIEDTPEILASLPDNIHRIWVCSPKVYDLNKAIKGMRKSKR
ncbi:MAG: hypothetical protein GF411_19965 [Candidatus Lokiarchaeota archaeon]|nr:hypothetical protein [Candidatus Lokiarchaeota archaeon]